MGAMVVGACLEGVSVAGVGVFESVENGHKNLKYCLKRYDYNGIYKRPRYIHIFLNKSPQDMHFQAPK